MPQLKETKWWLYAVLVLVVVGSRFLLLQLPPDPQTPSNALLWVTLKLLPFLLLFLLFRNEERVSRFRWILFFTLLVAIWLAVDPFGPQFLRFLASNQLLSRMVERVSLAASGWLFPIISLAIFMSWLLLQRKRMR
jgi:hypothetical protein